MTKEKYESIKNVSYFTSREIGLEVFDFLMNNPFKFDVSTMSSLLNRRTCDISQILNKALRLGFVEKKKEGRNTFYALSNDFVKVYHTIKEVV